MDFMLVLTRKAGQEIHIGDDIVLKVLPHNGKSLKLGIEAPRGVTILRGEVLEKDKALASEKAREAEDNTLIFTPMVQAPKSPPSSGGYFEEDDSE